MNKIILRIVRPIVSRIYNNESDSTMLSKLVLIKPNIPNFVIKHRYLDSLSFF